MASGQPSRSFGGSRVPSWSGLVPIRLHAPRLASTHVSLAVTCSSLRGVAPSSRFAGTHVSPVPVSVAGWRRSGRTSRLGSHSFPVRLAGTRVAVRCRPVGVTVPWRHGLVAWLLGATFLLTYVSLVVGSFWGLLFGVLVAVFLGCHIWLVVTVLVGHILLAGRGPFRYLIGWSWDPVSQSYSHVL